MKTTQSKRNFIWKPRSSKRQWEFVPKKQKDYFECPTNLASSMTSRLIAFERNSLISLMQLSWTWSSGMKSTHSSTLTNLASLILSTIRKPQIYSCKIASSWGCLSFWSAFWSYMVLDLAEGVVGDQMKHESLPENIQGLSSNRVRSELETASLGILRIFPLGLNPVSEKRDWTNENLVFRLRGFLRNKSGINSTHSSSEDLEQRKSYILALLSK